MENSSTIGKNRDSTQVQYEILKTLIDGGTTKTRIMQLTMVSWKMLHKHLSGLEQLQLLRYAEDPDTKIYLTDKGEEFLQKYEKLIEIFDLRKIV